MTAKRSKGGGIFGSIIFAIITALFGAVVIGIHAMYSTDFIQEEFSVRSLVTFFTKGSNIIPADDYRFDAYYSLFISTVKNHLLYLLLALLTVVVIYVLILCVHWCISIIASAAKKTRKPVEDTDDEPDDNTRLFDYDEDDDPFAEERSSRDDSSSAAFNKKDPFSSLASGRGKREAASDDDIAEKWNNAKSRRKTAERAARKAEKAEEGGMSEKMGLAMNTLKDGKKKLSDKRAAKKEEKEKQRAVPGDIHEFLRGAAVIVSVSGTVEPDLPEFDGITDTRKPLTYYMLDTSPKLLFENSEDYRRKGKFMNITPTNALFIADDGSGRVVSSDKLFVKNADPDSDEEDEDSSTTMLPELYLQYDKSKGKGVMQLCCAKRVFENTDGYMDNTAEFELIEDGRAYGKRYILDVKIYGKKFHFEIVN
ncbi:MAG: hypothetical protein IJ874_03770 [Ruminococcus sp.]|nr:hypothetical protein [Ruminococcus sp.]